MGGRRGQRNQHTGKTHCSQGHPLSGENVYVRTRPGGRAVRECRQCATTRKGSHRKTVAAERIGHGLCSQCGERPLATGSGGRLLTRCATCNERNNEAHAEWRYERLDHVRSVNKLACATRKKQDPIGYMLVHVRHRAKKRGVRFSLTREDITIPSHCPLLGVLLRTDGGGRHWDSPSLDRIVPELGYVPGNVWVISLRANAIKSNATVDELQRIADGLRARLSQVHRRAA